jgi:salicylate hydroxylase
MSDGRGHAAPRGKAIIVGAGIGGLTAALCLLRAGWEVEVLEQAQALSPIGAGIQISPNGARVLFALGLSGALEAVAFRPESIEMRLGRSGFQVYAIPLREAAIARWGAPYLHIHRADLVELLVQALQARAPNGLRTGVRVDGYSQTASAVRAHGSDGAFFEGDLLIGADGIHSVIRTAMLGPGDPRFTGNVAWRIVVPIERLADHAPPPTACVWVGPGRHAVTYRLRGGALANFVGVVEQDGWTRESWTEEGTREEALADYRGWHPIISRMIKASDHLYRWALYDRDPLPSWTDGRVALLGDACHPMLPFAAQGGVMAIEDAWCLAQSLDRAGDVAARLESYARGRHARTAKVQQTARANAGLFHHRRLNDQVRAYAPQWWAARTRPMQFHARQDWLYGHDVTAPR